MARGRTEQLPLQLTMLPHQECGTAPRHAEHQAAGAEIPIFNPEVPGVHGVQHLVDQAAFLGMAILTQKNVGDQHPLLIQNDQSLPGQRGCPGAAQFLEAVRRR